MYQVLRTFHAFLIYSAGIICTYDLQTVESLFSSSQSTRTRWKKMQCFLPGKRALFHRAQVVRTSTTTRILPVVLRQPERTIFSSVSTSTTTCNNGRHLRFPSRKASRRNILSSAIQTRLDTMTQRHNEIMDQIQNGTTGSAGEISSLAKAVQLSRDLKESLDEQVSVQELLEEAKSTGDNELLVECEKELVDVQATINRLEKRIVDAVLPKDMDDFGSGAIVEVRSGTGGDEASLFANELKEAYIRVAKSLGWKVDLLSEGKTEIGGIREASFAVSGSSIQIEGVDEDLGPYGVFKFESGVHRVQRIPINDTKLQTSACSVAVLPSTPDNSPDEIPSTELKIETMRASGAGGQHVNTTDSAVRITHIPTGISVSMQDERSQIQNKKKALKLINARVRDQMKEEKQREIGIARSSLLGGGDRSERIRTYNFQRDQISDHRSKETRTGIAVLLGGSETNIVLSFLPTLRMLNKEEQLATLEKE